MEIDSERKFRPDVEGLRAVAVALVVLVHAGVPWIDGGYIGVDVFFVLSGFLITGLLVRERASTGATSMAGFYARRARRILPAATVVLIATVLASYHWLGFLRAGVIAEDGKWTAVFAANLRFASEGTQYFNILTPPSPLQHYWSLAVEEQFYLVWPLLFLVVATVAPKVSLAGKLAAVLALIAVASFTWSVVQTQTNVTWAFFSPLTRAWELAIGALLAVSLPSLRRLPAALGPWLSWAGVAGVVGSAFLFDGSTAFPGYAAALPVLSTAIVIAGGTLAPRRGAELLLGLVPFQWLGKLSYSLYLWHWPVLLIAEQQAGRTLPVAENLGWLAVALALAAAVYYIIENPIRYAKPLTQRPWASLALGLCLVLAAYGLSAWQISAHDTAPTTAAVDPGVGSMTDILARVSAAADIKALPKDLTPDLASAAKEGNGSVMPGFASCGVHFEEVVATGCVLGDPAGSRSVYLVGDSHAAMWIPAFDAIGKRLQWKVLVFTKIQCPAISISISRPAVRDQQLSDVPYPECGSWLDYVISQINATNPNLVVLASSDADVHTVTGDQWAAGRKKTLDRITSPATRKAVLRDIPPVPIALDCLAAHQDDIQACSVLASTAVERTFHDFERMAAIQAGAAYVDVFPWFCTSVCTVVIGNTAAYSNDQHLSPTYAAYLSGALQSALEPIMDDR